MSATDELDTPEELAASLKVTPPTVMNWYRTGIIPAQVAVGRIYRFDRAECRAALSAHAQRERGTKNLPPAAGTTEG